MGIESVVDEKEGRSSGLRDAMCSSCEMAVVWMQNQLRQNQTQDRILSYVNEVSFISCYLLVLHFCLMLMLVMDKIAALRAAAQSNGRISCSMW